MLYTFHSKAAADVMMLDDLAGRLFGIIGRKLEPRGILTQAQLPEAIAHLEKAIEIDRLGLGTTDPKAEPTEDRLYLSQRAFPFLELLRKSLKKDQPVVWGQ
ncbi:MAG: DUF1840 domain-containing protein [Candidatus Protistobacter heckmanni]|nr:DUF1840 domain-containing protein [Candidatus Protistobacter heckmanni]